MAGGHLICLKMPERGESAPAVGTANVMLQSVRGPKRLDLIGY